MTKIQTNKLSIYLIKKGYASPKDILKNYDQLEKEDVTNVGNLFYKNTRNFKPQWIEKFFNNSIEAKIFNSVSSAILLVYTESNYFAITFGYGHTLLNSGVWEERFGLKIALNTIGPENLISIDKKNMSITPKLTREQVTEYGTFADFGVDIEQDLIQGITGKSMDERFGKTITGKDALGVSTRVNISNIKSFLKACFEKYKEDGYKEYFGWIDNIFEVKNPRENEMLDKKLIEKIKNGNLEKTWMSVPEIIEWQDVSEFKLKRNSFGNDLDIPQYLNFLSQEEKKNISAEVLKKQNIRCISASSQAVEYNWSVYKCLYCEVENTEGKTHILSDGKWYQIENDFLQEVSESFNKLKNKPAELSLPECNQDEHEGDYNERITSENSNNMCNMDKKVVQHGGAKQKIEFCDLLTKNKKIIHVKKYGASSVLSHLFLQGLASGELLYLDPEFRKKLNNKLPDGYKLTDTEENPNPSDYEVIFAIISKSEKDLDIPFFSKVNIKSIRKKLESFGYSVSLLKISTKN